MCVRDQFSSYAPVISSRTLLPSFTLLTCPQLPRVQPDEFLNEQHALRQILYQTPRRTELFIVLTMYNVRLLFLDPSVTQICGHRFSRSDPSLNATPLQEDEVLFCRTMHGVMSASSPCEFAFRELDSGRSFPCFPRTAYSSKFCTHREHPALVRAEPE